MIITRRSASRYFRVAKQFDIALNNDHSEPLSVSGAVAVPQKPARRVNIHITRGITRVSAMKRLRRQCET